MRLKEYIKNLQEIEQKYGNLTCVYSRDDEGNGFQEVHFEPSVGVFVDGDFDNDEESPDAVCVN